MTTRTAQTSLPIRARVLGLVYLMAFPIDLFGFLYVPSRLVVPGDAATTASNIIASETLFRLGIVSILLGQIVGLLVVLALYKVLKGVNNNIAVLMVIFGLVSVSIGVVNEFSQFAILLLLHGPDNLTVFSAAQLNSLVPLLLNLHNLGIRIDEVFNGLELFFMGYLVFKSGFLPRIVGVALVIACFGYLIQDFSAFLFPNLAVNVILLTGWGELIFPLWLLVRGINVERWEKRALAAA
ncbi:MAG TPA: DUF4386 domain-containing protein [Aggregatilineales bacterium]|nr:DUF4386 domain-containing protein [Aggregatilineales bacterium]